MLNIALLAWAAWFALAAVGASFAYGIASNVKAAALSDFEEAVDLAIALVERDFWNKAVAEKKDLDAARPAADELVRYAVAILTTRRCRLIVRLSCQSFDDMVQASVAKHGTPW